MPSFSWQYALASIVWNKNKTSIIALEVDIVVSVGAHAPLSNRCGIKANLRTFAPKSSYGEIFFISPLELVHKVLTPKMKKKKTQKLTFS